MTTVTSIRVMMSWTCPQLDFMLPPRVTTDSAATFEHQMLALLGGRLKSARLAQRLTAVAFANELRVSRTTLRAVEQGKPSASIGTYLRVMSALGLATDVSLLATGALDRPVPHPPANFHHHGAQDYQTLLMHVEAVRLLKQNPDLVLRAMETLRRWREGGDARTFPLWDEWARILETRNWRRAVARTERGNELRQASPLATLLPQATRLGIIQQVKSLKARARNVESA